MKISVFYEHIVEASSQTGKSISEICKMVSLWGIMGIEIENIRLMENKDQIMKTFYQSGLEISCIYGFFDFAHETDIKKGFEMIDLACEVNAKKVMLIPGFLKPYEKIFFIRKRVVSSLVNALSRICSYAKDRDITVVLEDFDGESAPFATASGLKYFIDNVPDLYCAFDTGNFLFSEEDSLEVLPLFLNRIKHVHCKDRSFEKKSGEIPKKTIKGRDMYSCAVGKGCIKMKEIIEILIQNGYDDYFAVEHFGSLNQLRDMEESAKWLNEF